MADNHNEKFAALNRLCQEAVSKNANKIMILNPEVLGDNYEELIHNLNKIAEAGLALLVLPPSQRKPEQEPHLR